MKLNINATLAIVALTAAAVSAFYSWRINERDAVGDLQNRIAELETTLETMATKAELRTIREKAVAVENKLTKKLDRKLESSDLSQGEHITSVALAISRSSEFSEHVERIIPSGAVVAFDTNDGCPDEGWSRFTKAQSRTIVGAAFEGITLDANLTPRPHDDKGGSESVRFTTDQTPRHQHTFRDTYYSEHRNKKPSGVIDTVEVPGQKGSDSNDSDNVGWQIQNVTDWAGEAESVAVMPPYIALFYCIRN